MVEVNASVQHRETVHNQSHVPLPHMTPLAKENVWRRSIQSKLAKVGLEWVNFQLTRRTRATLMNGLGVEGKLVADQLRHSLDVNQNVYTQSLLQAGGLRSISWRKSMRVM
jgi:integrase